MAENIYTKLQAMRVELQSMGIKKSGRNTYSGYDYYELADILPPINVLQQKYETCSYITFTKDEAVLTLVNSENPEEKITFSSPMEELALKAAHPIQNLGGIETYQRRYLYMAAFEIIENDYFDATQGKPTDTNGGSKTPKKAAPVATQNALTPATSEALNSRVKEYSEFSGRSLKEITEELKKKAGKDLKSISEDEGQELLKYLNTQIEETVQGGTF